MSRSCTICMHPDRLAIDLDLVAKSPIRGVSRKYFGSANAEDSLRRHKAEHLPLDLATAVVAGEVEHGNNLVAHALDVVAQLNQINAATLAVLKKARATGDGDLALKAIDRVQRQIELQAKLLGDLDERPVVNVLVDPQWIEIRTTLLRSLQAYPEARVAVSRALREVEHG